ncbi:MAG: hypothetical protein U5R46_19215 [Gammaproteobacteria bacterium]|nr:hypothetical protein [Gammaproteobacteria bacterium]
MPYHGFGGVADEAGVLRDNEVTFGQGCKRRVFRGSGTVERNRVAHVEPATLADWAANRSLTLVKPQRMSLVKYCRLAARHNLAMDDIPSTWSPDDPAYLCHGIAVG